MPKLNQFENKLKIKIDNSFLQKYQHPSEQIVFTFLFIIKITNFILGFI